MRSNSEPSLTRKSSTKDITQSRENNPIHVPTRGSTGTVFQETWKGTLVAVKYKNNNHSEYIKEHFENEIKIAKYLTQLEKNGACNDYVMHFLDVNSPNKIMMTFMSKGDLVDCFIHHPGAVKSFASRIVREILGGIKFLHDYHIIHRDIKCENVLIDEEWHAKLSDFGFSVALPFNEPNKEYFDVDFKGSPGTAAPELIRDKASGNRIRYTFSSDMFAAGVVVYEVFKQDKAYPADYTSSEILSATLDKGQRPPITGAIPSVFSLFLKKAWKDDPKKRPTAEEGEKIAEDYCRSKKP